MIHPNPLLSSCSGCTSSRGYADAERRHLLAGVAVGGLLSTFPFLPAQADKPSPRPMLLVDADAETDFKPLRPADLQLGKPVLVFPFDPQTGSPKNESRLNKLIVIRLAEDQMEPDTRSRSTSGVLAYSGICTHQGCDVKTWIAKEKVLACFCHASKFALLEGAKVISGPAPKALPAFALAMDGEFLSLATPSHPSAGQ